MSEVFELIFEIVLEVLFDIASNTVFHKILRFIAITIVYLGVCAIIVSLMLFVFRPENIILRMFMWSLVMVSTFYFIYTLKKISSSWLEFWQMNCIKDLMEWKSFYTNIHNLYWREVLYWEVLKKLIYIFYFAIYNTDLFKSKWNYFRIVYFHRSLRYVFYGYFRFIQIRM